MTIKINTPNGAISVSGKKSALNNLAILLYEAATYNSINGCPFTAGYANEAGHQIHQSLSDSGYYKCVPSDVENKSSDF